jgi:anti-anti-sigma factor
MAVVTLPDEIDLSNAAAVQEQLMSALSQLPSVLIADMTPTTFCDSGGVRAIMLIHRQATSAACELRLVVSSPAVLRVFSLIGADQVIDIHPDLGSALGQSAPR